MDGQVQLWKFSENTDKIQTRLSDALCKESVENIEIKCGDYTIRVVKHDNGKDDVVITGKYPEVFKVFKRLNRKQALWILSGIISDLENGVPWITAGEAELL